MKKGGSKNECNRMGKKLKLFKLLKKIEMDFFQKKKEKKMRKMHTKSNANFLKDE